MKLHFNGFESDIPIEPGLITVLEIHNQTLFRRIALSLSSEEGYAALEPYSLWDGEKELSPHGSFLKIASPLDFLGQTKTLETLLYSVIEDLVYEDDAMRLKIQSLGEEICTLIQQQSYEMDGNYNFKLDWNIKNYLKAFGFGIEVLEDASYLDNLMNFLNAIKDLRVNKPLVFFNLKTFLSKNELSELYERIFFLKIPVLLLENKQDTIRYNGEKKIVVDLHFLEN